MAQHYLASQTNITSKADAILSKRVSAQSQAMASSMAVARADVSSHSHLTPALALLPPGIAWPKTTDAVLTLLTGALARAFSRTDRLTIALFDNLFCNKANDLASEYDTEFGVDTAEYPLATRRKIWQLLANGDRAPTYSVLSEIVDVYGFGVVRFVRHLPFRAGHSCCGDAVAGEPWRFVLDVYVSWLGVGSMPHGRLEQLQAALNKAVFAHSLIRLFLEGA